MSMKILKPGLLTSVQDLGRSGYQQHGVIVSGAMDSFSLRMANILTGNPENQAVLEVTLIGPVIEIEKDCLISVTGGDLSPAVDGCELPMWRPVFVKKGSILQFGLCKSGCRAYIAVSGGFKIPEVMGSRSTYLKAGIGGFKGRALQTGDRLNVYPSAAADIYIERMQKAGKAAADWAVRYSEFLPIGHEPVIRVTEGRQFKDFTEESTQLFQSSKFTISNQSDRMGYRISGPELKRIDEKELLSEAVSFGSIQVPSDGNPIILMADRQTTGGYAKIAQILSADLPLIGQMRPGQSMRFALCSLEEAERVLIEQENKIRLLKAAISLKLKG
ncbi:5-oxoprolinase subunit C family protein [Bacillus massiliglaciei]|uniref:5-oxoprolinase subunit C family protein n=1 Tax=Bacillus massiliglaciei TaxID=1816693 RepID=UPI000DA62EA1|nr:biotin-dependent carboxyltransferase family protein [Bacillus massiliglaciei]